jgi:mannose-6-phosphate isomerase-like protein (cupin superfamily)
MKLQLFKTNFKKSRLILKATLVFLLLAQSSFLCAQNTDIKTILETFVESYKNDNMALTATFGIQIGDEWWHVHSERKQEGYKVGKSKTYTFHNYGPNEVTLHSGKPEKSTWYFKFADRSVLDNINNKVWTASTASMRSMPSDVVALDVSMMEGVKSSHKIDAISYLVLEHFWKKDAIEISTFSRDSSLPTHGASAVSLYTMKDKRIAWFSINKEEVANEDPAMQESQIPNLMIFTKGKGKGLFGDEEVNLEAGMSVFIGPYTKHVIFNPYDEPLEGILVLYGDNIDYALGQSYLDFLEQQNEFLLTNQKQTNENKE